MSTFNTTGSNGKVNPQTNATQWQFRQQTIPARLCYLLREGKITSTDLLLIFTIDALVKPQGERDGIGCWASNKYLGQAVNVHQRYVSERIQALAAMGLVLSLTIDGQRYLELEWSRTAEERQAIPGKYGKALRKAHQDLVGRLGEEVYIHTYTGKPVAPPTGKPVTNNSIEVEPPKGGSPPDGQTLLDVPKPIQQEYIGQADQLRKAIREAGLHPTGGCRATWAEEFRKLSGVHKDVAEVLDWFCPNCGIKGQDEHGLPEITNAKAFRQHFGGWIRRRYRIANGLHNPKRPLDPSLQPDDV